MSDRFEKVTSSLLAAAAVVIASVVVYRQFVGQQAPIPGGGPPFVENWRQAMSVGTVIGDTAAPVKIVEFTDLECPACREFYRVVHQELQARPKDVSLVFVHFPLSSHRFALPAARAADCARQNGAFDRFVDVAFTKQDSMGLKSWTSYALEAGVTDTAAFGRCTRSSSTVPLIDQGRNLGERINVQFTPTILLNGWRYTSQFTAPALDSAINAMVRKTRKG